MRSPPNIAGITTGTQLKLQASSHKHNGDLVMGASRGNASTGACFVPGPRGGPRRHAPCGSSQASHRLPASSRCNRNTNSPPLQPRVAAPPLPYPDEDRVTTSPDVRPTPPMAIIYVCMAAMPPPKPEDHSCPPHAAAGAGAVLVPNVIAERRDSAWRRGGGRNGDPAPVAGSDGRRRTNAAGPTETHFRQPGRPRSKQHITYSAQHVLTLRGLKPAAWARVGQRWAGLAIGGGRAGAAQGRHFPKSYSYAGKMAAAPGFGAVGVDHA